LASWLIAVSLSLINLAHLRGAIPWLRRVVGGAWQILFWITLIKRQWIFPSFFEK